VVFLCVKEGEIFLINISDIGYYVDLLSEDGSRYRLDDALLSLQWEEQKGQLAQRAILTVANVPIGTETLMKKAKINCVIMIYAKMDGETKLVFEGKIWEWQYDNSKKNEVSIIAYDNLIRLQQSKDFKYYSAGMTTQAIIGDVCKSWSIPLAYKWSQSITHEKKKFSAESISEIIFSLLEEVRQKKGEKYVAYYRDAQLQIVGYGNNSTVYRFSGENTISTVDKLSLSNLVTRVKVIGKEDKKGRAPVDAVVDGNLKYGVLQEIIRRDSNKKLADAKADAETILKERGKPEETIQLNTPDLPFIRKGDAVEVSAGNLKGVFYVEGVSHNATSRQMILALERVSKESEFGSGVGVKTRPVLKKGSRGKDVSEMQKILLKRGQKLPIYGADGIFGNETQRAVKNFQKSTGLSEDGICGPQTWAKLEG